MFEKVHRVESIVRLAREKVPHYGPLLEADLHAFREEIVRATVGAGIAAVSGLIFACFLSAALGRDYTSLVALIDSE
jgi:hypothetical protein